MWYLQTWIFVLQFVGDEILHLLSFFWSFINLFATVLPHWCVFPLPLTSIWDTNTNLSSCHIWLPCKSFFLTLGSAPQYPCLYLRFWFHLFMSLPPLPLSFDCLTFDKDRNGSCISKQLGKGVTHPLQVTSFCLHILDVALFLWSKESLKS